MLIADDSALLRKRLKELLRGIKGVQLAGEAANVGEALAAVRSLEPDLVLLDIQMPGGSGIEVLREVKRQNASIIVIMFTNHTYPQYQRHCAEFGADYFLCKSTDSKLLIEIIEQLAAERTDTSAGFPTERKGD